MTRGLLLVLVACSHTDAQPAPTSAPKPLPVKAAAVPTVETPADTPSCVADSTPYDAKVMRARLEALADPELDGRASGTDGDRAARALIVERFKCLGLTGAGDDGGFEQSFKDDNGASTANIVGYVLGASKPDEIVMVGAHHDHLGGGLLGANDNASGVVGLLSVAHEVMARETKPARTIAFVTFGAEEQGLVGSQYFVAHAPETLPLAKVVQYINIDMIGSHASKNAVFAFGAFGKQPSSGVLEQLAKKFKKVHLGIGGQSTRGDHYGFCKAKIPYVFFWTPDARCYHEKCDKADKIDYPRLVDIAQIAGGLTIGLADSEQDLAASKGKLGCGQTIK